MRGAVHHIDLIAGPAEYPAYGAGYYALFFADPDGLSLSSSTGREMAKMPGC